MQYKKNNPPMPVSGFPSCSYFIAYYFGFVYKTEYSNDVFDYLDQHYKTGLACFPKRNPPILVHPLAYYYFIVKNKLYNHTEEEIAILYILENDETKEAIFLLPQKS